MALRKRAVAGRILYWILYLPLTAALVLALVLIPARLLNQSIQPISVDAAIFEQRTFNNLAGYSPSTGVDNNKLVAVPQYTLAYSLSPKAWAYVITVNGKEYDAGQEKRMYFDGAKPLAGINYNYYKNQKDTIIVEQTLPKKYATQ